jgi:hypothetical protein
MVSHREVETQQVNEGSNQPFGLPQGQAEDSTQRQCRGDRQSRIVRLTAPRGPRLSAPGRDRLVGEPDRQTSALLSSVSLLDVPLITDFDGLPTSASRLF